MSGRRRNRRGPSSLDSPLRRFPWYLLTGLLIGIFLGITYTWLIAPVQYLDTEPASLQVAFKDQYRALIAAAYAANGDLARAQARLALLEDPRISDTLAAQAQRALAAGHPAEEVRALAQLALIADAPPASIPTAAPLTQFPTLTPADTLTLLPTETPSPTLTPQPSATPVSPEETPSPAASEAGTPDATSFPTRTPTITPLPSNTPTPAPTSLSPFILDQRTLLCDPDILGPLLIVQTMENAETGIPGVEIILYWSGGEEHFFTGLKPELGLGYADFAMIPGLSYTLRLADGSQLVTDLTATQCQASNGETIWGSWQIIFIQP